MYWFNRGYTSDEVVDAINLVKRYTWYEYCLQCLEDSGIEEDRDFICRETDCVMYATREALDMIRGIEGQKGCLKK